MSPDSPFTQRASARRSFLLGFRATAGLAAAAAVFGILFGILALSRGLDGQTTIIMSAAMFAGAAQVAVLELWQEPLPYVGLFLASALVCSRHILMGITLHDVLKRKRPPLAALFVLTDANWVLTSRETAAPNKLAFFAGSGFAMYSFWVAGTVLGVAAPGILDARTLAGLAVGGALYIAVLLCIYFTDKPLPKLLAPGVSALVTLLASHWADASIAILAGVSAAALLTWLQEQQRA